VKPRVAPAPKGEIGEGRTQSRGWQGGKGRKREREREREREMASVQWPL